MTSQSVERVLEMLSDAKRNGVGWQARCPAHDDHQPSLSIAEGDDGRALVNCHAGCTPEAVVQAMGLAMADLMPLISESKTGVAFRPSATTLLPAPMKASKIFATADDAIEALERQHGKRSAFWTYHDIKGNPIGIVVRWDTTESGKGKMIRPVSFDTAKNGWVIGGMSNGIWGRPLYRLPDLADADRVYIVEGEKSAEAVRSLGLIGTTSPHGSKSAAKADWRPLAGKQVVILPDNDPAGEQYAQDVKTLLAKLNPAPVVKIIKLTEHWSALPKGGDLADVMEFNRGDTKVIRTKLERLVSKAKPLDLNKHTSKPQRIVQRANVVRLSDVQPGSVQWLWPNRFALGKLTMLAGDPGLGKSFVTLDMASRVSTGLGWPDTPGQRFDPGGVVLLSAEDDVADTIRPRLDAAGADVTRIIAMQSVTNTHFKTGELIDTMFCLETDIPALENAITQVDCCKLVIIDPITAYCGKADAHNNAEVRGLLAPLSDLAARHGVAVLAVTHLNKSAGGPAIYRTMGSLAFTAAARAVWGVIKDKDNPQRRLVLPVKNNIAQDVTGLAYEIHNAGMAANVSWEDDPLEMTADDAMDPEHNDKPGPNADERDRAATWLCKVLAKGLRLSKELIEEANQGEAISLSTLNRARQYLKIKAYRPKNPGPWYWRLPTDTNGQDQPEAHGHPPDAQKLGNIEACSKTMEKQVVMKFSKGILPDGQVTEDRGNEVKINT